MAWSHTADTDTDDHPDAQNARAWSPPMMADPVIRVDMARAALRAWEGMARFAPHLQDRVEASRRILEEAERDAADAFDHYRADEDARMGAAAFDAERANGVS